MNRIIIRVVLILSFIILAPGVDAQSTELNKDGTDPAILVRGPVKSKGFPLLYPNAIKTWSGYYRYMEMEVVVSFSRENILKPDEWKYSSCTKTEGIYPNKNSFYYRNADWSLLFQFHYSKETHHEYLSSDNGHEPLMDTIPEDQCTFINLFITRLKYFLRDADPKYPPLFPAILEF